MADLPQSLITTLHEDIASARRLALLSLIVGVGVGITLGAAAVLLFAQQTRQTGELADMKVMANKTFAEQGDEIAKIQEAGGGSPAISSEAFRRLEDAVWPIAKAISVKDGIVCVPELVVEAQGDSRVVILPGAIGMVAQPPKATASIMLRVGNDAPVIELSDQSGVRLSLGVTDLVNKKYGNKETTAASTIVSFDKSGESSRRWPSPVP